MTITPQGSATYQVATPNVSVVVVPANVNGGYITNPFNAEDQGQTSTNIPQDLFINPVTDAAISGNDTTVRLAPGETFTVLPNSTAPVSANSTLPGHKFTVIYW